MPSSSTLPAAIANYRALVGFVTRKLGNRQDAHDVVHDAWLRVAERHPELSQHLDSQASRAYLYAVAENLVIDHFRRHQRQRDALRDPALWPQQTARDITDTHCLREAIAAVDQALAGLPVRCRAMFLADRLDGQPQADIASQHGVSVKTVEREVQRAMDAIEQALHRWRGDPARPAQRPRRRALSTLLSLAGLGLGSGALWAAWQRWVPQWQMEVTARGTETLAQTLPDGSQLALDAQGEATVRYYAGLRHVQLLRGTAFFNVQRNTQAPFVVEAGSARITVLGTRFEVALEGADTVRVTVEHGHVRVEQADSLRAPVELRDGECLRWRAGQAAQRGLVTGDVALWRTGWIDLPHVPLDAAITRLGHYCRQPVRVEPSAALLRVFGRVQISQAQEWVQLLPNILPVRLRTQTENGQDWIVIARA